MEVARNDDGDLITIDMIRGVAAVPVLWCPGELPDGNECAAKVYVKALNSKVMAAHFAAQHEPQCDRTSEHSDDQPGDQGHQFAQGLRPVRWRLRLGESGPSQGPDGRRRPDDTDAGTKTRRRRADSSHGIEDTADDRSFSTLLMNILAGKIPPSLEVVIGARPPESASSIIVAAPSAHAKAYTDRDVILWGKVRQVKTSSYGSLILKLEDAADDVAILVDKANMHRLGIDASTQLVGRHVIAYGKYTVPDTGRPHLRVERDALAFNPRLRRHRRS